MLKKLTKEGFIEKAREVHGDKYDYSKVEYIDNKTQACIICPKHGEFWQTPNNHTHKTHPQGCPKCGKLKIGIKLRLGKDKFIEKAREIHKDKYNYSKVEYVNNMTPVCISCPEHGEFKQRPVDHLNGRGCPKCGRIKNGLSRRLGKDEFIKKASKVHGDKYDYSKVELVDTKTLVCIICPEHGEFWQTPNNHLKGIGCPKCGYIKIGLSRRLSEDNFIGKAIEIHGDKYDYSKVELVDTQTLVCIICPKHGEFWQTPNNHLSGKGCPKCGKIKQGLNRRLGKHNFIEKAIKIHGDKYGYSKVEYKGINIKVCIICPEHGEFWQTPNNHLRSQGCPKCKSSKLEIIFAKFLLSNGFIESIDNNEISENTFIHQKKFDWLKYHKPLSLDFYIPDYNIAIECQGGQHFKAVEHFGGEKGFTKIQKRDSIKKKLCESHGIKIFYYSDLGIEYPYKVYEDLDELLNEIKNINNL